METSLFLREIQRRRLSRAPASVQWHESIDHITPSNDSFTMLVAHEFFDALPVHVFRVSCFCSATETFSTDGDRKLKKDGRR